MYNVFSYLSKQHLPMRVYFAHYNTDIDKLYYIL